MRRECGLLLLVSSPVMHASHCSQHIVSIVFWSHPCDWHAWWLVGWKFRVLSALCPSPRSSLPFGVFVLRSHVVYASVRGCLAIARRPQMYTNEASLYKHTHIQLPGAPALGCLCACRCACQSAGKILLVGWAGIILSLLTTSFRGSTNLIKAAVLAWLLWQVLPRWRCIRRRVSLDRQQ